MMMRSCFAYYPMLLLLLVDNKKYFTATNATPIDKVTYRELTDGFGNTGACRGNGGGADRVDARYKVVNAQSDCETECDNDNGCIAYGYSTTTSDCLIYGPGEDGICSLAGDDDMSETKYHNYQSCGDCSMDSVDMPNLRTQNLCGSCSKDISPTLSNSESICSTYDGVWTPGTWTAGVWQDPTDGWAGESFTHDTLQPTMNVHSISVADGFHCYDKVHEDGQPMCSSSDGDNDNNSCQVAFEDLRTAEHCPEGCVFYPRDDTHGPYCDGLSADGETSCIAGFESSSVFSEESCGVGCVYTAAPTFTAPPTAIHAPPIDLGPGWIPDVIRATEDSGDCAGSNLPQCEGKDHIAGFGYGVCRIDQAGLPNGAHINQKWCGNCVNTNGDRVNLNEAACAQTCLDDPSGTCVAFSHADGGNCLIYGVDVDQYLRNPGDVENEWKGWTYKNEPCVGDRVPVGCTQINTIKPNQKFVCRHLMQDQTRWLAWGPTDGSNEVTVTLMVVPTLDGSVSASDFTDDMTSMIRSKMASVAFVDASKDVSVSVMDDGNSGMSATVKITIMASDAAVIPMTGLLDTVLISKTRDGSLYFFSETTGGGSNQNTGVMLPQGTHIAGISVEGMRHNLVTADKEPYVRGWSENSSMMTMDTVTSDATSMSSDSDNESENMSSDSSADSTAECPKCEECNESAAKQVEADESTATIVNLRSASAILLVFTMYLLPML